MLLIRLRGCRRLRTCTFRLCVLRACKYLSYRNIWLLEYLATASLHMDVYPPGGED